MGVQYLAPLRRAIDRGLRMLFRPFVVRTWFVLGFAAFLSGHVSGRIGGQIGGHRGGEMPESGRHVLRNVGEFFAHPFWTAVTITIVLCILAVAVAWLWVSSRGKFVFLDDVVRGRAAIVEPWSRLGRLGDSLFGWQLAYFAICVGVAIVIGMPFISRLLLAAADREFGWEMFSAMAGMLAVAVPFALVVGCINLFLSHFVVPIMYRQNIGAIAAWGRFLDLFRGRIVAFLLYALFVFVLWVLIGVATLTLGFLSCCIGLILLSLPYVGSVLLLPAMVPIRALGPEFLAQFGPDYDVFAAPAAPPAPAPGAPA